MFSLTHLFYSTTLHNGSVFVDGVLQLLKLQLAHQNARTNRQHDVCVALEREFMREVESFRPCFTLSASLEVADEYSTRLYRALHYFGLHDDPLARQLNLIVGRKSMRAANDHVINAVFKERTPAMLPKRTLGEEVAEAGKQGNFALTRKQERYERQLGGVEQQKGKSKDLITSSTQSTSALTQDSNARMSFFDLMFNNTSDQILPTELPNPPKLDVKATRRRHALRMPDQYRGHWVLQEPDIAITREERREDPW